VWIGGTPAYVIIVSRTIDREQHKTRARTPAHLVENDIVPPREGHKRLPPPRRDHPLLLERLPHKPSQPSEPIGR
jgi:hypothetical protein